MFSPNERAICRIVGTPIGNLGDLTPRAVCALQEADIIFAEDTRTAKGLLSHLGINKETRSYYKDNERQAADAVIKAIEDGKKVALISEAGMPGVSDPGWLLINTLIKKNLPFEVVPGVSAGVMASVASGLCQDGRYLFAGFLPHKGAEAAIKKLKSVQFPIVFYESPHRVVDTLKLLLRYFEPPIAVCRELTKMYEEILWIESENDIDNLVVKGEFCIVVNNSATEANDESGLELNALVSELARNNVSSKTIVSALKAAGIKRNIAYQIVTNLDIS